jgi:hypothetical protein
VTRVCHPAASLALAAIVLAACDARSAADAGTPQDAGLALARDAPQGDANVPARLLVERCFVPLSSSRTGYAERLRGLWLAENVANWTGLLTEAERREAPFFTDEDWGSERGRFGIEGSAGQTITLNTLDPWGADDDTDVEMIYLEAMRRAGSAHLGPLEIREAWRTHIVPSIYVWVSNRAVRDLFDAPTPVLPPSSSLLAANDQSLMIDAQLTTELFGALAPGRPAHALALANLPILATATGYAAHAAQVHVVLYALAPVLDPSLDPGEQNRCLVRAARRFVPNESKTAAVIDLVLALREASADPNAWERARDEVARVLQSEAEAHGYRYLEWYESAVNLATGLLALLFGEGDLVRTIQIGALSGWDSDNGTATMGGLLGLLHGEAWVRAELSRAGLEGLSDRYRIARTRVAFPQEIYTLEEIAALALPRVDESLRETGGAITGDRYEAPRLSEDDLSLEANPYVAWLAPSVTRAVRARGDAPTVSVTGGTIVGSIEASSLIDGLELDASGRDLRLEVRDEARLNAGEPLVERHLTVRGEGEVTVAIEWSSPLTLAGVRFVEGPSAVDVATVEVLRDEGWIAPALESPLAAGLGAFAIRDARFRDPQAARGVRLVLRATPGRPITLLELDGLTR